MKVRVVNAGVTVENSVLDVDIVVEMSKEDATRLVNYGLVEAVEEDEAPEDEAPEQAEMPKKPTRGKKSE